MDLRWKIEKCCSVDAESLAICNMLYIETWMYPIKLIFWYFQIWLSSFVWIFYRNLNWKFFRNNIFLKSCEYYYCIMFHIIHKRNYFISNSIKIWPSWRISIVYTNITCSVNHIWIQSYGEIEWCRLTRVRVLRHTFVRSHARLRNPYYI